MKRFKFRRPSALALAVGMAASIVQLTPASAAAQGSIEQRGTTVTMCGDRYCAEFDGDQSAVLRSLTIDGVEVLDPAYGIHSSVTTSDGTATSRELSEDPSIEVDGNVVFVRFSTSMADEVWTFNAGPTALEFNLERTYHADANLTQQGTPRMVFAENAFDQMRWPGDGGNFPLGGDLVNEHQHSWLAAGDQFNPNIRTSKEQAAYTMLDAATRTALSLDATTNHDDVDSGRATEVWRSAENAGKDLNVALLTAADGLKYAGDNPTGYGYQTTKNGAPVFKPVAVTSGQTDDVTLRIAAEDYEAYYDLGKLNGVNEDALSAAINNYARWMMQDVDKGASTESPQLQSEVPPLEMQWIGQMLELFPEDGAISAFQRGLEDIRDHLTEPSGRVFCCYPGFGETWGHNYGDQASGYALGVAAGYRLSGDDEWLASMAESVRDGLQYVLDEWTDPETHFVRNVDPDLGEADYNNDYWESSTGEFNGYTTALLYDALSTWSVLARDVLDDDGMAGEFSDVAQTIKTNFNKNLADGGFWSPDTKTFLYGSGNQDALYLPVNAEVLKTDLASYDRRTAIVNAIEEQNAAGNYDLHPMNVRDLYIEGATAATAGKGGENGGWYGAPDGDYYAGLPLLNDPQVMQTALASFLLRYQADGFYGASTWDRDQPLNSTAAAQFFPTTVMPAWGLYHYGYGLQPTNDRLMIAPHITKAMAGSSVEYTWRGTPLTVTYRDQLSYRVAAHDHIPVTVRWINQEPGGTYRVAGHGGVREIEADDEGNVDLSLTTKNALVTCLNCAAPGITDEEGTGAVDHYDANGAEVRDDAYEQVGMQVAVGPHPVEVTSLGRYKLDGNNDIHRVKLLDVDGKIVASAPVDMNRRAGRDGFVSAQLSEPITLTPGIYYVLSSETPGGDSWHDAGGHVETNDGVTVLGAASGRSLAVDETGATAYGPVTFDYRQVGQPEEWIQTFVDPSTVRARSGEELTFDVTVWGQASEPIDGEVTVGLPEGWTGQPAEFEIDTSGDPAPTTVEMTVQVPDDAPTETHDLAFTASTSAGLTSERSAEVAVANVIYDFDDGTVQGWQGGPGVGSVRAVTSIANGPGIPHDGSHTIEFDSGTMSGPDPRTIFVEPSEPLDLSNASTLYAHVNSYGAWPLTPDSYEATITVYSGTDSVTTTTEYDANVWNRVGVDIADWAGRSSITKIEVTYVVNVDAESYRLFFDLDSVGWDA